MRCLLGWGAGMPEPGHAAAAAVKPMNRTLALPPPARAVGPLIGLTADDGRGNGCRDGPPAPHPWEQIAIPPSGWEHVFG